MVALVKLVSGEEDPPMLPLGHPLPDSPTAVPGISLRDLGTQGTCLRHLRDASSSQRPQPAWGEGTKKPVGPSLGAGRRDLSPGGGGERTPDVGLAG